MNKHSSSKRSKQEQNNQDRWDHKGYEDILREEREKTDGYKSNFSKKKKYEQFSNINVSLKKTFHLNFSPLNL